MQFKIEQVALAPFSSKLAIELLRDMGLVGWTHDIVEARGQVFGQPEDRSIGMLSFNYEALKEAKELEVLQYTSGKNWMQRYNPSASHIGMHCSEEELAEWREFFRRRRINVAQEVFTLRHTNEVIAGKRWYHYVIFDTRPILGLDVKFIVRLEKPGRLEG